MPPECTLCQAAATLPLERCRNNSMQINCTACTSKAVIQSRKQLDLKVTQLYCSCKDPHCGHTFVMDLTFSHSLSPSGRNAQQMVLELLRALPLEERQQWLAMVG